MKFAFHVNAASMKFCNVFHIIQTQTVAFHVVDVARIDTEKLVENLVLVDFTYADAVVFYADYNRVFGVFGGDGHRWILPPYFKALSIRLEMAFPMWILSPAIKSFAASSCKIISPFFPWRVVHAS